VPFFKDFIFLNTIFLLIVRPVGLFFNLPLEGRFIRSRVANFYVQMYLYLTILLIYLNIIFENFFVYPRLIITNNKVFEEKQLNNKKLLQQASSKNLPNEVDNDLFILRDWTERSSKISVIEIGNF